MGEPNNTAMARGTHVGMAREHGVQNAVGRGLGEIDGSAPYPSSCSASLSGDPPMIRERIHTRCFQESKLSVRQDSELQPKFGAWLRANSRGTEATVTARSRSRVLLEELKRGLEGRDKAYTCQLILSLRYADTHSELVMKQRSLHPDRINAIPARGGHKAAVSMTEHARLVMSSSGALTPHLFAEVGEIRESDPGLFEVSITTKFSTNITSPSHGNRTMFWRAEVMVALGDEVLSTQCDSPAFEYPPRPPKIGDAPRLHTVITDGRPGDHHLVWRSTRCGAQEPRVPSLISGPARFRAQARNSQRLVSSPLMLHYKNPSKCSPSQC